MMTKHRLTGVSVRIDNLVGQQLEPAGEILLEISRHEVLVAQVRGYLRAIRGKCVAAAAAAADEQAGVGVDVKLKAL